MKQSFIIILALVVASMLTACAGGVDSKVGEGDSFAIAKKKGQAYLDRGTPTMALPSLRRARELEPNDPDVLLMLGMAYDQSDRPVQALEVLEKAQQIQPEEGRINNNLGVALMRLDRLEEARHHFEIALRDVNFPVPEEVYFNLSLLHKGQGRSREQISALEKAIQTRPGFVPALLELVVINREMGRLDKEQQQLRQVLVERPNDPVIMEMLADSYVLNGKRLEAREWLLKIRSLDSGSPVAVRAMEKLKNLEKVP